MLTPEESELLLQRLGMALQCGVITVELTNQFPGQPYQWVVKEHASRPTITARVRDYEATNGVWLYWWCWPWRKGYE